MNRSRAATRECRRNVWAGNTLKTNGEDFAECLHLIGVRPVYLGQTTRVLGIEPIPLEEPDALALMLRCVFPVFSVTCPNLIKLIDQAVTAVAALDEPLEMNYIKKHILEDMEIDCRGYPEDQALDQAYVRVYGCAPGCYGTAVAKAIDSKQWKDYRDLAKIFETWSSYAYTQNKMQLKPFRKLSGAECPPYS